MSIAQQDGVPVEVSIVVPTYNQADKLRCLLASIERLLPVPSFELIVVNDCSPDATGDIMREWMASPHPFHVEYVELTRNSGPAAARNAGIRKARAAIVAFTDSDCRVTPDWLKCLIAPLDREKDIVGVGGMVYPVNPRGLFSIYNTITGILESNMELHFLITCNCCYLRECLAAAGGFDEDVLTPGGEDIAMSMKVFLAGGDFAMARDAAIYHDYRESFLSFVHTWKNYAHGCGYIVGKYFADKPVDLSVPWNVNTVRPPRPTWFYIKLGARVEWEQSRLYGLPLRVSLCCVVLRELQLCIHYEWFRRGEAHFKPRGRLYGLVVRICAIVSYPVRLFFHAGTDEKKRISS